MAVSSIQVNTQAVDRWRRQLAGTEEQIQQGMRDATVETAGYAERLLLRTARQRGFTTTSNGIFLRNMGKSGVNLTVTPQYRNDGLGFLLRANGPWGIVETGARAHDMPGRRARNRARTKYGTKPYQTPFGLRSRVRHPGMRGRRVWSTSMDTLTRRYPRVYRDHTYRILQRRHGGSL